jgi:chemotaxis protein histidine kinase CheA
MKGFFARGETAVDDEKQRVLGFFIEGAQEHLNTIERALLDLRSAVADPEQLQELFRAAHSVKGDAAMLNLNSINKVAHRLEDCFKILQETKAPVDQQVESLFLRGFDSLHELVEKLQAPQGLREEDGQRTVQEVEPVFAQLQGYLTQLGGGKAKRSGNAVPPRFAAQVKETLREMLQIFRQPPETPAGRQRLQQHCDRLAQLDPGVEAWPELLRLVGRAIANPQATYAELAAPIIKEINAASDNIVANRGHSITPSAKLRELAGPEPVATSAVVDQICVAKDPKAAAVALIQGFDRKQLVELTNHLIRAIKGQ